MMAFRHIAVTMACLTMLAVLTACAPLGKTLQQMTPTTKWEAGMPRESQPDFPELGQYWIIDNGCGFSPDKVRTADGLFEALRKEGIAEVAVICQTGIVNKGATNNDKIWLRDWARFAKMGDVEDDRSVVWLIRPDVDPQDGKIAIEISRWLYWYTAIDYAEGLGEASRYANAGDYDGALVAIARSTNEKLRELWENHQPALEGGIQKGD